MALDPSEAAGIPDELIAMYTDAELALLALMVDAITRGIDSPEWAAQQPAELLKFRAQAQTIAAQLQAAMPAMVGEALDEANGRAVEAADEDVKDVPKVAPIPKPDSDEAKRAAARAKAAKIAAWKTLSEFTAAIPKAAEQAMVDVTGQIQVRNREVPRIGPATGKLGGALTPEGTRLDAAQQALDILAKRGITGFKDASGRNWSLTSYIEMKSRTIVNNELREANAERMLDRGQNLVVISSHSRSAPQCQPYEGQVISLDGETGTVIRPNATGGKAVKVKIKATMADARSKGLFHPNCGHTSSSYVPGASKTFTTELDLAGYKATQDQRALERDLRELKRAQALASNPLARKAALAKVKAQQAAIAAHTKQHNLKRRTRRESPNVAR